MFKPDSPLYPFMVAVGTAVADELIRRNPNIKSNTIIQLLVRIFTNHPQK
jgi:hypothetical protein